MFSKLITLLSLSIIGFNSVAFAESVPKLSLGKYELVSGEDEYCGDLEIQKRDLSDKYVKIGKERMSLINKQIKEPSDFDPNCEDHLVTTREDNDISTKLSRTVTEVCRGQVKSSSVKTVIITADKITTNQKKGSEDLGTCVYSKR